MFTIRLYIALVKIRKFSGSFNQVPNSRVTILNTLIIFWIWIHIIQLDIIQIIMVPLDCISINDE